MFYLLSFVLLLGPLVFVHEFGHYLFAKIFNVRVDVFSMGFGPKIFKKQWGETEYCLSIVPLGGYVKLFGQDPNEPIPPELKERALNNQEAWKRFLVFIGGPLFNFLFAIFVFALMMLIGEQHLTSTIGRVVPGTQAEVAGFRSGDVVTAVNRAVVTRYDEVYNAIAESPNKEINFRVRRDGRLHEVKALPRPTKGMNIYGEVKEMGEIEGLSPLGRHTVIGISDVNSAAAKQGLKTGDEILTINGKLVRSFEEIEAKVNQLVQSGAKELVFGVVAHEAGFWSPEKLPSAQTEKTVDYKFPAKKLNELGIHSSELFVSSVIKGSPAEIAGVAAGDRLVSIEGKTLHSFSELRTRLQEFGESKSADLTLAIERIVDGKTLRFQKSLTPSVSESKDAAGKETKQYLIGVYPLYIQAEPDFVVERVLNPLTLTAQAWLRALDLSGKTVVSLKKLFFREVSVGTLGGPIMIGKLAGDSMSRGISQFLKAMALISISLAIFNMLPVPILDGGHIFLLGVEVIRGKPISMKQTEFVQQIGLSLIVLLLVVVLFNDFTKVGIPAIRNMFQ